MRRSFPTVWLGVLVAGLWSGARGFAHAQSEPHRSSPGSPQTAPAQPGVISPKALGELSVAYPEQATGSASVRVHVVVQVDGSVTDARIESGPEPFASAVLAAASSFRFEPAQRWDEAVRSYVPISARIALQIDFSAPSEPAPPPDSIEAARADADSEPAEVTPPEPAAPPPSVDVEVLGVRQQPSAQLSRAEVRQLPGAFGDPFRAVEGLPGVTPVVSGLPFFYVRGAPPGNLGYFFDGISVPSLYHVAVGPGVISPAFIENVELYSGAAPVRYGRFAGPVIAGTSARPQYRLRSEANVRLVDAGAMVEVPFDDARGSLMLAGRYSYTGALVSLLVPDVSIGYWDYQGRLVYDLDGGQTITLFGFGAYDHLTAVNEFGTRQQLYDVAFHRLEARYETALGPETQWLVAVGGGLDATEAGDDDGDRSATLSLRQINTRSTLSHRFSKRLQARLGAELVVSRLSVDLDTQGDWDEPEELERDPQGNILDVLPVPGVPDTQARVLFEARQVRREAELRQLFSTRGDLLTGLWLDFPWQATPHVSLTPGLRLDLYKTGTHFAVAPEPRLDVRYQLTPRVALRHDVGLVHQPPSFVAPVPGLIGDVSEGLQRGVSSSAGVEAQLPWDVNASFTLFQTALFNGSDALGLFQLQRSDPTADASVDRVTGHSYGAELYLKRPLTRRWGGFVSYTLSRTTRSSGRLAGPSSFDRRHVLNLALANDLGKGFRCGGRVVFYTGAPAEVAYVEALANPPRTPPHFRLDLRVEKRWTIGHHGAWWALVLEVLNSTLNEEVLNVSCYAYGCRKEAIGPVTVPSLGVEAAF